MWKRCKLNDGGMCVWHGKRWKGNLGVLKLTPGLFENLIIVNIKERKTQRRLQRKDWPSFKVFAVLPPNYLVSLWLFSSIQSSFSSPEVDCHRALHLTASYWSGGDR